MNVTRKTDCGLLGREENLHRKSFDSRYFHVKINDILYLRKRKKKNREKEKIRLTFQLSALLRRRVFRRLVLSVLVGCNTRRSTVAEKLRAATNLTGCMTAVQVGQGRVIHVPICTFCILGKKNSLLILAYAIYRIIGFLL